MSVEATKAKPRVLVWNPTYECMPREDLEKLQLQRLKHQLERVYHLVPFYKKAFDEHGVKLEDIKSLDDIKRLPFTTKQDLLEYYPFGMFAVPMESVVRIHASSGTTGKPVVGGYTRNDLELWAELMARVLTAAGVTSEDIVHNAYGYGLFTGGLGFHMGAEKIGAMVVPISGGLTRRQVMLLEDFGATVLTCTPSYALTIAETAEEMGVNVRERLKLRVGIFGAEPWTEKMREEIQNRLGLEAYDIFGMTELTGPGVSVECPYHNGMHIFEDHFLVEAIDPDTGEPVEYGEEAEIVFTSLTREATPVIRYRTRDRARIFKEPCPCGRTSVRMSRVRGRTDDMLIIRGVNVFPSSIETVLLQQEGLAPYYLIVVDRQKSYLDELEVRVEALEDYWKRGARWVEHAENKAREDIRQLVGVSAVVKVVEPHSIQRSEGKAKRVIDLRDLK